MQIDYSTSRAFDYINLEKLNLVTGRPAHEWDLYIIKELIDNALDADDYLWSRDILKRPTISINVEYKKISEDMSDRTELIVEVRNQALFPRHKIKEIFDPNWYTSSKSVMKGVHRGALGNALKTLLGIPYAVRKKAADDYNPDLRPLTITCDGIEYILHYKVNQVQNTIEVIVGTRPINYPSSGGTTIEVCLDHFGQELSRNLGQIREFAYQYWLCNPQAQFSWQVYIGDDVWQERFLPYEEWQQKYAGSPHIQWYSNSFNELLNAVYTEKHKIKANESLTVSEICCLFDENQDLNFIRNVESDFGKTIITPDDFDRESQKLFSIIAKNTTPFNPENLGALGKDHISKILSSYFSVKGEILYANISTISEGNNKTPFVLEASVVRLKEGERKIWTAINFSPTYEDPFSGRSLPLPSKQNESVDGLREFMESYDFLDTSHVFLFLHLICPNIVKTEYSKTKIEVLPFKKALVKLLDHLFTQLKELDLETERLFEDKVHITLTEIIKSIRPDERFVFEQIFHKLRFILSNDPELKDKITGPSGEEKLKSLLLSNDIFKNILNQRVIKGVPKSLTIPYHPDQYINISLNRLSVQILNQNRVGKILFVQTRELESVIIENGWLCKLDMALLRSPSVEKDLEETIYRCMKNNKLPFIIMHDSDKIGQSLMKNIQKIFQRINHGQQSSRVIDVGLHSQKPLEGNEQVTHLIEMLPDEILKLLTYGLAQNNIPFKTYPTDAIILKDVKEKVDDLLRNYLWKMIYYEYEIPELINEINNDFHIPIAINNQSLEQQIKEKLSQTTIANTYDVVLADLTGKFFRQFVKKHETNILEFVSAHLTDVKKGKVQND